MNKKIFHGVILEIILLNLINETNEKGLHGYAITNFVNKKFGIHLGPSTIYPELKQLEKQGLVISNWEFMLRKARRQYKITRKGQSLLIDYNLELEALISTSKPREIGIKNISSIR